MVNQTTAMLFWSTPAANQETVYRSFFYENKTSVSNEQECNQLDRTKPYFSIIWLFFLSKQSEMNNYLRTKLEGERGQTKTIVRENWIFMIKKNERREIETTATTSII